MKRRGRKILSGLMTLCLTVGMLLVSAGCTAAPSEKKDGGSFADSGDSTETETRIFTDSAGRQVEVPAEITRIIPSGDMAQMFLWPLASDKLVSVSTAITPEQEKYLGDSCRDLPETGNLYKTGSELNVEEVATLGADIIIDFGEAKDSICEDLDNLQELLGIPCVFIEGGLTDSAQSYRMLGELLGMEEEAEELALYIEGILEETDRVFETVEKKEAVILNGTDGLGCIASGTYFDEVWAYMVKNVAVPADAQMYASTRIDFEQLANWDPDFLFFYNTTAPAQQVSEGAWPQLRAVKSGQWYPVPAGPYSFVSPPAVNRYLGILWIGTTVYPGEFSWDLREKVKEYYNLFYHYELSDAEYDALMQQEK